MSPWSLNVHLHCGGITGEYAFSARLHMHVSQSFISPFILLVVLCLCFAHWSRSYPKTWVSNLWPVGWIQPTGVGASAAFIGGGSFGIWWRGAFPCQAARRQWWWQCHPASDPSWVIPACCWKRLLTAALGKPSESCYVIHNFFSGFFFFFLA